jgi:hypothetical protein
MVAQHARQHDGESCGLPVIRGPRWFGPEPKPFVLRAEIPVSFDEMVAAIYGTSGLEDLASAEDVCGSVVVAVLLEGLPALEVRSKQLRNNEAGIGVESAAFLGFCRRQVAALIPRT